MNKFIYWIGVLRGILTLAYIPIIIGMIWIDLNFMFKVFLTNTALYYFSSLLIKASEND